MFLLCFIWVALSGCGHLAHSPDAGDSSAVPISAASGSEVVLYAMGTLGVPYAAGGGSPKTGFDCSGLVAYAYARALRFQLPRTTSALSRTGLRVDRRDLRPGDLVFFNTQWRPYSHVGIYIGDRRFIHAPSSGGVVRIDDMRQRYWSRRFDGARRVAL